MYIYYLKILTSILWCSGMLFLSGTRTSLEKKQFEQGKKMMSTCRVKIFTDKSAGLVTSGKERNPLGWQFSDQPRV